MTDYAINKVRRLLDEAMNPKGMHTNGPTYVRIEASLVNRLLQLAEAAQDASIEDRRIVEIHGIRLGLYRLVLANGEELERECQEQPRIGDIA